MLEKYIINSKNQKVNYIDTNMTCGINTKSKDEMIAILNRHNNFTPDLKKKILNIPEVILQNNGTLFAKKIDKMIHELFREVERCKQFTRTKLNKNGILYGKIELTHSMDDFILNFFHHRFPNFIICLYNQIRKETIVMFESGDLKKYKNSFKSILEMLSQNRSEISYFDGIDYDNETLFEEFYSSQFIKTRENRKYFKKWIPNKCMKLPGLKNGIENRFRNNQIDKYI